MAKGIPAQPPAPQPRVNPNPLTGLNKVPLGQAIGYINQLPTAPPTQPTVIVVPPPRPLI